MLSGDAEAAIATVAVAGVLALAVDALLARLMPRQSPRRRAVVAAACLPLPLAVLSGLVFLDGATGSRERCGVDACAMAMAGAMFGVLVSLVGFGIGLLAIRILRQPRDRA